jgi:hypothetical protein
MEELVDLILYDGHMVEIVKIYLGGIQEICQLERVTHLVGISLIRTQLDLNMLVTMD